MKNKIREIFQIKRRRIVSFTNSKRLLLLLSTLVLLWLSGCTLFQKQESPPQSISEEQYLDIIQEYGFHPQRRPEIPRTPIPFKTVAEARTYIAEAAKFIRGQSDGKVLRELQLRYPTLPALEQHTSLKLIPLLGKLDIFAGSNYKGYRYGLINPNNLEEAPRILEIIVDKKSESVIIPGDEALARSLYASLTTGAKIEYKFTGYAFLYTDKYRYKNGKSYINGQVFTKNVKLTGRRNNSTSSKASTSSKLGMPTVNRCVRWMDYYASDGTYITSTCLEYINSGGDFPWGGDIPSGTGDEPSGGGSGGGGGSDGNGGNGGGSGGSGEGTFPVEDNPEDGIAIIRQQYGQFPGQQTYVTIAYSRGSIFYFDSGLTGAEGTSQWIHQVGQQSSYAGNTYNFNIAFKVNTILPSGYVVIYGTPHILTGTYNIRTTAGYLSIPRYW